MLVLSEERKLYEWYRHAVCCIFTSGQDGKDSASKLEVLVENAQSISDVLSNSSLSRVERKAAARLFREKKKSYKFSRDDIPSQLREIALNARSMRDIMQHKEFSASERNAAIKLYVETKKNRRLDAGSH